MTCDSDATKGYDRAEEDRGASRAEQLPLGALVWEAVPYQVRLLCVSHIDVCSCFLPHVYR